MSNWVDVHLDVLAATPAEINAIKAALQEPCQLLSLAPHIAQVFCCKASWVKFVKSLVESAGYEPEIRDGGFYFPLS